MADPDADDVPPNGSPEPARGEGLDAEALGMHMSDQFVELLGLWTQQMTALAEAGIDPTPLVRTLAGTLRWAADQLDPSGAGGHEGGPPA